MNAYPLPSTRVLIGADDLLHLRRTGIDLGVPEDQVHLPDEVLHRQLAVLVSALVVPPDVSLRGCRYSSTARRLTAAAFQQGIDLGRVETGNPWGRQLAGTRPDPACLTQR